MGIKIYLHCFEYGRGKQPELNKYCEKVYYYKRETLTAGIPLRLPYIVSSRINPQLIKNILKDNYPVLLEGIHCTYYLYHGELSNRKVLVRLHNVEYEYYGQLAKSTNNFYKKVYFTLESRLLIKYEKIISVKAKFIAVNEKDKLTYQKVFSAADIEFLPVFVPFNKVNSKIGNGKFCLYHGNLSVAENEKAVFWLLEKIFHGLDITFIIAGKNPSSSIRKEISKYKKVQLIENPSQIEMEELIINAQIHLLPSFNTTGIKIKLLNALFNGRFIITNATSLNGTGLETLCCIAESPSEYIQKIKELFEVPFNENEIKKREIILKDLYNNEKNARQLIKWL
ncbi:MAG TPA: glycosyltransferase family 4 protein [Hanamia sp.]|nr:glycosyltransferase family 4 protein [Hanamia sp.]